MPRNCAVKYSTPVRFGSGTKIMSRFDASAITELPCTAASSEVNVATVLERLLIVACWVARALCNVAISAALLAMAAS